VLALHGPYAESGDVQKHLERHAVPFTGTRNLASARARNKADAKAHLSALKDLNSQYKIPPSLLVANSPEVHFANTAREVFQRFGPPYVVKPVHGGNSHSIEIAETVFALPAAIERVMGETGDDVLIEQYVLGRHVSSYVVEGFRNQDTYVLPTVETNLLKGNRGITREQKRDEYAHTDVLQHVSLEVKKQLEDAAREIHEKLDLSHYSKIDFILAPHGAYFLEANTHPDLGANSALPKPLDYVGSTLKELYHHLKHIARQ
jgi:D-alanine-D-alanine ligase